MSHSSLKNMQQAFMQGLVDRDKVPEHLVDGDSTYAKEHFQIYQNNATLLLIGALKNAFPSVHSLVGEDFFKMMSKAFMKDHLPTSFDLFTYGSGFGSFIESYEPAINVPYLADIATLDWARQQAYHAPKAKHFDAQLFAASISDGEDVLLKFSPSAHLISSRFPILQIWSLANGTSDKDISLDDGAEHVLVLRPEIEVTMLKLHADEFIWLENLHNGMSFCQAAPHIEESLQEFLAKHLAFGTFQSFQKTSTGDLT